MRNLLCSLALLGALAFAQQPQIPHSPLQPRYQFNSTTSGAAKVTVQATTTSGQVSFEEADIYCAAAQTATVYVNGTAATTTAGTVTGPIGVASAVPPAVFTASNVGTGTTLKSYPVGAGALIVLDMTPFLLPPGVGGAANLSIGVTGTCTVQIQWVNQ